MFWLFEFDLGLQNASDVLNRRTINTYLLLNHRFHILVGIDIAGLDEWIARSLRVVQVVVERQHDPFHLFNGILSQCILS